MPFPYPEEPPMSDYATLTVPQLRERVLADDPSALVSKLRKAELVAMLTRLETERAANEAEIAATRDDLAWIDTLPTEPAVFPGDHRDGCECEDCDEFYANEHTSVAAPDGGIDYEWHSLVAEDETAVASEAAFAEFAKQVDEMINRELDEDIQLLPFDPAVPHMNMDYLSPREREQQLGIPKPNVTVTDVAAAGVTGLVQLGKRLVWGKLIDVIKRDVQFAPQLLVTVEVGGVRRLIRAGHFLAA